MRVKLSRDDWYVFVAEVDPFYGERDVEIPDELWESYSQTLGAFMEVQDELETIYREMYK